MSGALWLLLLLSCGTGAPEVPVEPPARAVADERPNVLIILWDTVRADHLSLYGHDAPTTPRIDAWAATGTVYEEAWSPGSWTVPSHASMFTGLATTTHGAHADHRYLDEGHITLAELLAEDGYDTYALSANLFVGSVANLLQGFETVYTSYPQKAERRGRYVEASQAATLGKLLPADKSTEISLGFQGNNADRWDKSIYKDAAPILANGLLAELDTRTGDAPWFAYLNFMEAHTPRIPTQASREALMSPELQKTALETDLSLFASSAWMVGKGDYSEQELSAVRGVYDAALRDLDNATGDLLDELERRGVLENTVVILVADHGESLGEHRMLEHRWTVHEPLLHVPLVIRYPKGFGPGRVDTPVSTVDLFATVLELTQTSMPRVAGLQSQSLRGPQSGVVKSQLVHAYAAQLRSVHKAWPTMDLSSWKRTFSTFRDGDLKYVRASDGDHALYDLDKDPGELNNLYKERAEDAARLHLALHAWEASLPPYTPRPGEEGPSKGLTPEERAQMEILGYLDPDEEEDEP